MTASLAIQDSATPDLQTLLRAAESLLPAIRERANQTETNRKLLPDTVRDLRASGLFRFFVARAFGGYEMPFRHHLELPSLLGTACGSTSWVYAVTLSHGGLVSRFPLEVQRAVWGANPDAVCANANAGGGSLEPAEGGWRLSGHWRFSSGCDYADWITVRARHRGDGEVSRRIVLRRDQIDIRDTWHAAGLMGSGSNDVIVQDQFVRAEFAQREPDLGFDCIPPNRLPQNPWGQAAYVPYFATSILGVLVGVARGALQSYADLTRQREGLLFGGPIAKQPTVQIRASEAAAEIDAGETLIRATTQMLADHAERGSPLSAAENARWRRDNAFATRLLVTGVDRLASMMGASGQTDFNPVQRHLRDAKAIAAHASLNWDASLLPYGQWLLEKPHAA